MKKHKKEIDIDHKQAIGLFLEADPDYDSIPDWYNLQKWIYENEENEKFSDSMPSNSRELESIIEQYELFVNLLKNLDHIQYVHQMQNLYFGLTGQELKIKVHS